MKKATQELLAKIFPLKEKPSERFEKTTESMRICNISLIKNLKRNENVRRNNKID